MNKQGELATDSPTNGPGTDFTAGRIRSNSLCGCCGVAAASSHMHNLPLPGDRVDRARRLLFDDVSHVGYWSTCDMKCSWVILCVADCNVQVSLYIEEAKVWVAGLSTYDLISANRHWIGTFPVRRISFSVTITPIFHSHLIPPLTSATILPA